MPSYTISWRTGDGKLSISEQLLSALEYPHVLIVERMGEQELVLYQRDDSRATGQERKVAYPAGRAMPRISIGREPARALGLREGRYQAWVEGNAIFAVPDVRPT